MSFILRNSLRTGLRRANISKIAIQNSKITLQPSSVLVQSQRTLFGNKFNQAGTDKEKREDKSEETIEKSESESTESKTAPSSAENAESSEIDKLTAEIEKLTKDAAEADKKNKLQLADLINTQKRVSERHEKELKYAPKKFAKSMLSAYDDLQRALDHAPNNNDDNQELKTFVEGIELTLVNLEKTFNKHEISKIEVNVGDTFDPNVHDAAVKLPVGAIPNIEANQVAFIQTVGWRYRDIELRAPKVGVITE